MSPTDAWFTFCNSARQDRAFPFLHPMKLFLQTAMIFFGTLLAAGLVALGEPGSAEVEMVQAPQSAGTVLVGLLGLDD
jgi:hypothetical protein